MRPKEAERGQRRLKEAEKGRKRVKEVEDYQKLKIELVMIRLKQLCPKMCPCTKDY